MWGSRVDALPGSGVSDAKGYYSCGVEDSARNERSGSRDTDVPVLVTDWRNGCLDVSIGRCESA